MSSAADLAHLIKILEAALKVRGEEEPISSAQRDPESDANNVGSIEGPSLSGSSTSAPPQNAAVEEDPLVTAHRLLMTVARRRGIALPPFADVGSSPCASTSVGMENATAGQETSKTCRAGSSNNKNGRGTPPPPSSSCPYVLAPPSSLSRAPASLLASTSTTSSSSTGGVGSATAGLVHYVSHQPAATAGGGLGLPAGAGRSAVVSARTSPRLVARDAVIMTAMCPCDEPSTSDGGGERQKQCQVTNECGTQTAVDGALGVVHAEEQVVELKQRGAHVLPPLVPSRQGHGEEYGRIDALNACTEAVPVTNTGGARGSRPSSAQKKSNTHGYGGIGSGGNGVKPIDEGSDGGVGIERGEGKAPTLAPKKVPSWTMGVSVSALSSPISRGPQAPAAKGRALSRDEKAGVSAFPAGILSAEDNGVGFSAEGGPHPQSDLELSRCSTSSATFMPPHDDSFEATSYGYSYRGEDANGEHDNENKEIEEEEGCVHHHGLDQRGRGASLSSPEAAVAVVNTMSHKKHYYDQQVQRLQQAEAARAEEDGGTQWPSSYTSTKEEGEGKRSSIHRAGSIISIVADPLDNSVIVAGESSFFSTERPVKLKDLKKLFPPPELYYSLVPPAPKKEPTHRQSNAKAETNVTSRPLSASSPSHSSSPKGKRSRRSKKRHGAQEDEEENIHYDGINESRAGMTTAAAAAEDNTISTGRGPSLPSSPLSKNKKAFASFHHPKDESNVKPPRAEDSFSSGASSPTEGRSKPASPTEAKSSRNNHITAGKKTKATESTSGDALVSREPDEASLSPSMSSPPSTPSNKAKKVFPRSGDKKEGSTHKSANPHKSTISTAEAVVSGQGNYGTVCKGYRIQNTTHVNTVQELPYLSSSSSLTSSASNAVVALKISKIKDKWSLDEVEALRHCSFVARRVLTTAGLAAAAACVPLSADFNSLKGVIGEASSPSAASSPQRPHSAGGGPSSSSRPASAKSLAALDPHLVAGALRVITLQGQVCYDPRRHCLWIPLPWIPTTLEGLIKFRVEWRKRSQNFSETASASASSPSAAGVGAGARVGARPAQRLLPPAPLFTLKEIQCVFRQLLQAVYFFSSAARVVHLDIKPANVLIRDGDVGGDQSSNQGNRNMAHSYELLRFEELPTYPTTEANDGEKPSRPYPLPPPTSMNSSTTNIATTAAAASIVLCDYGLMQHSGGELVQLGDYLYMSPEVYFCDVTATTTNTSSEEGGEEDVSSAEDNSEGSDGQEEEEEGTKKARALQVFSEQNDVWSVGCVVLEMLDGLPAMAWEANDAFAALKENYLAPAPRHVSQWPGDLVHCVSLCFERDPRVRLSARELLDHPFFRNSFGEGVH